MATWIIMAMAPKKTMKGGNLTIEIESLLQKI